MDNYLSTAEAAERLGITRQRVIQLIAHGRLPAQKFANIYMIRVGDLEQVSERTPGRPPKNTSDTTRQLNAAFRKATEADGKGGKKKRGGKAA
ncbi:MAG TPA: helix-turn-helix domain-containing protein [Pyrinomonadaceae bacterium]